ncbi:Uncharacterised protein [uncultured archaeon]|nr:Uncharacterised protein [uncultured archaeon]
MRIRYFGLMGILLLIFLILLAQAATSYSGNQTTNAKDDGPAAVDKEDNTTAGAETMAATALPNVQGIWKATIADREITMALNQSGDSIFGLAKSEGDDPWNGAVAGSLSQDEVMLSLASMPGKRLTATYLRGTVKDDLMTGFYIRSDSSGKAAKGEFTAKMVPNAPSYTPALVEASREPAASVQQSSLQNASAAQISPEQPPKETKGKFYSVTELAKGINPNIMPIMAPL